MLDLTFFVARGLLNVRGCAFSRLLPAESGKGEAINDPSRQAEPWVGPIPVGLYTLRPDMAEQGEADRRATYE
jgi:hypothetical protein